MRYPPPYPSLGQYRPYSADNHIMGVHARDFPQNPAVREAVARMLHYSRKIPPVKLSKDAHHTWKRMLRVQQIRARMDTIKNQARLYCFADAQHRLEVAR